MATTNTIQSLARTAVTLDNNNYAITFDTITENEKRRSSIYLPHIGGAGKFAGLVGSERTIQVPRISNTGGGLGNTNFKGFPVSGSAAGMNANGIATLTVGAKGQTTNYTSGEMQLQYDTYQLGFSRSKLFEFSVKDLKFGPSSIISQAMFQFTQQAIVPEIDYVILTKTFLYTTHAIDSNGKLIAFTTEQIADFKKIGCVPYKVINAEANFKPEKVFQADFDIMNPANPDWSAAHVGELKTSANTAANMRDASNIMQYKASEAGAFDALQAIDLITEHYSTALDDQFVPTEATLFIRPRVMTYLKNSPNFTRFIDVTSNNGNIDRRVATLDSGIKVVTSTTKRCKVYGWADHGGWNHSIKNAVDKVAPVAIDNQDMIMWLAGNPATINHVEERNVSFQDASSRDISKRTNSAVLFSIDHDCFVERTSSSFNFFIIKDEKDVIKFKA